MNRRRLILISAGIPAALICFIILTIIFVPGKELQGVFARALGNQGYTMHSTSFGLAFPVGIRAGNLEIGSEKGPLLKLDKATVKVRILPLFLGKLVIDYWGIIGKGEIGGEIKPLNGSGFTVKIARVRLEDIPFFPTVTGSLVKGDLSVNGSVKGQQNVKTGELKLAVKEAQLSGVKIGEMPLPDATYKTVQGMLRLGGAKATLESLTLEGEGLYVRLKGDMPLTTPMSSAPLNLTLELMPKAEFLEKQKFVFLLLLKYQTSPGHYQIPIRGTLGKPAIS